VRDHRRRLRPVRELRGERSLEPHAPPRTGARRERPHAAVLGQHAGKGPIGEHDHLVDPAGKRPDHRHGRRQCRVARVDLLGDEDEAHG
jgi:hypothetical protein